MRTRMKGRCQLKLTTLGAAKVCFLEENGIARVCEAHFCSSIGNSFEFPIEEQKALRAGTHCGGEELCRYSSPTQVENPAKQDSFL